MYSFLPSYSIHSFNQFISIYIHPFRPTVYIYSYWSYVIHSPVHLSGYIRQFRPSNIHSFLSSIHLSIHPFVYQSLNSSHVFNQHILSGLILPIHLTFYDSLFIHPSFIIHPHCDTSIHSCHPSVYIFIHTGLFYFHPYPFIIHP